MKHIYHGKEVNMNALIAQALDYNKFSSFEHTIVFPYYKALAPDLYSTNRGEFSDACSALAWDLWLQAGKGT